MAAEPARSAYLDALHLLSRRGLTVAECRDRLRARGHQEAEIDAAIARLLETGGLNDQKLAVALARTAVETKGRGRLRVVRELQARGVDRDVAGEAVAEVFGEKDERSLVAKAIQKKLRGRPKPSSQADFARLYQYLMRQGFSPAAVTDAIRKLRGASTEEVE